MWTAIQGSCRAAGQEIGHNAGHRHGTASTWISGYVVVAYSGIHAHAVRMVSSINSLNEATRNHASRRARLGVMVAYGAWGGKLVRMHGREVRENRVKQQWRPSPSSFHVHERTMARILVTPVTVSN